MLSSVKIKLIFFNKTTTIKIFNCLLKRGKDLNSNKFKKVLK